MINYYLITKPGIIFGNLLAVGAGFLLASKGQPDYLIFVLTMLGLGFIIASACVFNNLIDRERDQAMRRTRTRPSATGQISVVQGVFYATILGLTGAFVLGYFTNWLTLGIATIGFAVYVLVYSLWKARTKFSTAIGSVSGAIPPVVGYCAVTNHFDLGALILFSLLILWQMPHFFAIAIFNMNDYAAAKIPVLPLVKGMQRTKIHMACYIAAFAFVSVLLTYFNYTGWVYLSLILALSLTWFVLCLKGFKATDDVAWGKQMFRFSLVLILAFCLVIPFDTVTTIATSGAPRLQDQQTSLSHNNVP